MAVRKSELEWKQAIADYKASGLSVKKWCEKNHIKMSTYKYWFARLKKQENQESDISWAEMSIPSAETEIHTKSTYITLRYESFAIDISESTNRQLLAEVLKTLQSIC